MANILSNEKQTMAISALAEGASIRSIERITGIHRETIMRLGVGVPPINSHLDAVRAWIVSAGSNNNKG